MIEFRQIDVGDLALAFSPLLRGVEKTFGWISEHGGIPLTPIKAFKRVFVHWAAVEFDWPDHTESPLPSPTLWRTRDRTASTPRQCGCPNRHPNACQLLSSKSTRRRYRRSEVSAGSVSAISAKIWANW